jgi:hypothetical protein
LTPFALHAIIFFVKQPRARTAPPFAPLKTRPSAGTRRADQRIHMRFDKMFPVVVGSEIYGDAPAIARNVSAGGMLVEMAEPLPLGSVVTVHFRYPRESGRADEIVARAEVKHHYCLNFAGGGGEAGASRGVGLRFLDFDVGMPLDELLGERVLH